MLGRLFTKSISRSTIKTFLPLIIVCTHCLCRAEYFSSVDSLKELVEIEMRLVKAFREHIDRQEKLLPMYDNFLGHVKAQHKFLYKNAEEYLGNPLNAFKWIDRMVTDWNKLRNLMTKNAENNVFSQTFKRLKYPIPDYVDLRGSVVTLVRLQKMYNLRTDDLANGLINGIDYGTPLNALECYEIAKTLFKEENFSFAISWFKATFKKLLQESYDTKHKKIQIEVLTYMGLANMKLGFQAEAEKCMKEILKISYSSTAEETSGFRKTAVYDITKDITFANYSRLCQGKRLPDRLHQTLKCTMDTRNNPFFLLAPLKKEEVSLDPEITLFHGILNDVQIAHILWYAAQLEKSRSQIFAGTGDEDSISDIRVSQQTWLFDNVPIKQNIYSLMSEITGFDMINSEAMQVANYASGGVYEPHLDHIGEAETLANADRWVGDRISTSVFYLSNVEQGGYTVFPNSNVYLRPEKGSLAMWYNLHRSLDADKRLLHAGCPVIKGSKRIANVWIHSGHQEFARPCELTNDAYKSKPYVLY